jgi:hypothetical protein
VDQERVDDPGRRAGLHPARIERPQNRSLRTFRPTLVAGERMERGEDVIDSAAASIRRWPELARRELSRPRRRFPESDSTASFLISSIGRVARRRGFFAELQHQQRVREQLQRREQAAAVQAHNRAVREEARLRREYERELAAAQRLQARTTAESIRAHKALQVATAQMKTAQAADVLDQSTRF